MAQFYCSNCGNLCNENAVFCSKCGTPLTTNQGNNVPPNDNRYYTHQTPPNNMHTMQAKIPGRGFGISSLVLGIIGIVLAIMALNYAVDSPFYSLTETGDIVFVTLPILSTVFGFSSRKRGYVRGTSISGIVMGIIGISLFVITFLMCL